MGYVWTYETCASGRNPERGVPASVGGGQYRLATDIGVQPTRINQIVKGKTSISADTALRLGRHFGMSAEFWINLQGRFNLQCARDSFGKRLEKEVSVRGA